MSQLWTPEQQRAKAVIETVGLLPYKRELILQKLPPALVPCAESGSWEVDLEDSVPITVRIRYSATSTIAKGMAMHGIKALEFVAQEVIYRHIKLEIA